MPLIFFFEKKSYFSGVMDSGIKIRIFGTQPSHLWNTTVTSHRANKAEYSYTELTQVVKVTTFRQDGQESYKGDLTHRHVTRCKQEYMDHKLVALNMEAKEMVIDTFRFPSCCSCYVDRSIGWH